MNPNDIFYGPVELLIVPQVLFAYWHLIWTNSVPSFSVLRWVVLGLNLPSGTSPLRLLSLAASKHERVDTTDLSRVIWLCRVWLCNSRLCVIITRAATSNRYKLVPVQVGKFTRAGSTDRQRTLSRIIVLQNDSVLQHVWRLYEWFTSKWFTSYNRF